MSRGHEDRLRQKFDDKMRRSAEKAKEEKAAKQTPPTSPSQSGDPHVKDEAEKK
ncbi:MAG TPA: hypothetical protein VII23_14385 [Terriglobales bacterium]|jgi:hypothetical protein